MKNKYYIAPLTEMITLNTEHLLELTSRYTTDAVEDRKKLGVYDEEATIKIFNEGGDDMTPDAKHSLWDDDEDEW